MPISRVVWSRRRCEQPDSAVAAQTKQHTCLCRGSETAILARNSVATQTQQGNGQCRGRERTPNPEHEIHLFPSTRGAREGDYHTGRRLSGSSGSFCCLSVLNDNGSLFRQTGAQRPRAGVSVGHTDVRHSLISAVGAHLSASGGVCGGSLCASLAAGRIGSAHPLLALIPFILSVSIKRTSSPSHTPTRRAPRRSTAATARRSPTTRTATSPP